MHVLVISVSFITTGTQPTTSSPSCGDGSGLIPGVVVAIVVLAAAVIVVAVILAIWITKRHKRLTLVHEKPCSSGPVYEEVDLSLKPVSENEPTPLPSALCEVDEEKVGAIAAPPVAQESHGQTSIPVELQGNPCYGTK